MKNTFLFIASCTMLFFACAKNPYSATNKVYRKKASEYAKNIRSQPKDSVVADSLKLPPYWAGTTNFGMRKPNMVIIHHTAQNSCEQTLQTFTLERTQVSAHYVICKDGTLHHMLNDYLRAWHAGSAKWGSNTDVNSSSIGIEIDNNGIDTFSAAQLNTLMGLLATLKKTYGIPAMNFIGHGDIAPTRKNDPNVTFPWKKLADKGFGLWYSDTTGMVVPPDFNSVYALRVVGYDVSKLPSAIQSFRRHFIGEEKAGELSEAERKVLYSLVQKYL
ncbi:N-acetylmuramoyl-L-alanine amidase [Ferruginibacter sp. HRS2-29]|uniref:N-acetylmuramoyl-L-alanine amidase n=1 Tax=Ferruginibacter sp. HRS2-29 TaxID=2487334 RepID=UPI0020CDD631|nr:N-acetylmuramoyl-L-alanine amidase [Ferruginibacter sp. HRS2-29]MCP9752692.1 N-acetylmuramoyl-L-alanine amidase [Ferruginibacter sp. HRS2-29]